LMQAALTQRKDQIFSDYIKAVEAKMEQSGNIRIYKEVLATIQEEEPVAVPRQRPQLPITR